MSDLGVKHRIQMKEKTSKIAELEKIIAAMEKKNLEMFTQIKMGKEAASHRVDLLHKLQAKEAHISRLEQDLTVKSRVWSQLLNKDELELNTVADVVSKDKERLKKKDDEILQLLETISDLKKEMHGAKCEGEDDDDSSGSSVDEVRLPSLYFLLQVRFVRNH